MADRKPTVLNPAGYQENLQDTDNLIVEAAPTADNHAVNKGYADSEIAEAGKWEESGGNLYPKTLTNNIGIGTDTPQTDVHIFGANPVLRIQDNTTSIADAFAGIQLAESGSGGSLNNYWQIALEGGTSTDHLSFKDGTTERVRFDSDGNVFIGGTLPSTPNISLNSSGSAEFAGDIQGGKVTLSSTTGVHTISREVAAASNKYLAYFRNYDEGVSTDRFTIASDGTTRIGGTLPSSPNINLNSSGSAEFAGDIQTVSASNLWDSGFRSGRMYIWNAATTGSTPLISAQSNNGGTKVDKFTVMSSGNVRIAGDVKIGGTLPSAPNISLNADGAASFVNSGVEIQETPVAFSNGGNINFRVGNLTSEYNPILRLQTKNSTAVNSYSDIKLDGDISTLTTGGINGSVLRLGVGSSSANILTDSVGIDLDGTFAVGLQDNGSSAIQLKADGQGLFGNQVLVSRAAGTNNAFVARVDGSSTNNLLIRAEGSIETYSDIRIGGVPASTPNISLNASDGSATFDGNVTAASFTGPVTGDIAGNADTATKLKTARNINGTSFDGTSAITTAKWGTARSLNGVSVDGSANATLEPYVERDDGSNAARYLAFVDNNTAGYKRLNMANNLTYNPSTNSLTTNITGNANTLDGINSTQFLRSDTADTATGKITFDAGIRLNDGDLAEFGSSADYTVTHTGVHAIHNAKTGDIYFQQNGTSRIFFDVSEGDILPATDNTGEVGTSANSWSNGRFTNFTVDSTLNVRGAIDLADNDVLRLGTSDDAELFHSGTNLFLDLNLGDFIIRDGTTQRFTFDDNGAFTCTGKITAGNFNLESLPTLP